MKTLEERGPDGRWLWLARHAVKPMPTVDAVREQIRADTGASIDHTTYVQYEGGKPVRAEHRPALVKFWGEPVAEPVPQEAPSDVASLVASIAQLVEALAKSEATNRRLLDELLAERLASAGIPTVQEVPTEDAAQGTGR